MCDISKPQVVLFILQVKGFGCSSFSLLFDDIETDMCPADKEAFSSFAHAQVSITNEVYQHLGEPDTFLFCPTGMTVKQSYLTWQPSSLKHVKIRHCLLSCVTPDYCAAFCTPNVSQSSYLHTVGDKLLPRIDILWTGKLAPNPGSTCVQAVDRCNHKDRKTFQSFVLFRSKSGIPQNLSWVHRRGVVCTEEGASYLGQYPRQRLRSTKDFPWTLQGKYLLSTFTLTLCTRWIYFASISTTPPS